MSIPTATAPIHVDIVLNDGFILTELAGVVEPLRIANRVLAKERYVWTYRAAQPGKVVSPTGASIEAEPLPTRPECQVVVCLGCSAPDAEVTDIPQVVRRYRASGALIVLLSDAAAKFIASHPDQAEACTTHWENSHQLQERKGIFGIRSDLAQVDGQIVTSAGMGATAELMLSILQSQIDAAQLDAICQIMLVDRIRPFKTEQTDPMETAQSRSALINKTVALMRDHLEDRLQIRDLVDLLGTNTRTLEREFQRELGCSPGQFYRQIRLDHAHRLLLSTDISIQEVGLAAGFGSGFAAVYRRHYNQSPQQMRKRARRAAKVDMRAPDTSPETHQ